MNFAIFLPLSLIVGIIIIIVKFKFKRGQGTYLAVRNQLVKISY